jgi:midasin
VDGPLLRAVEEGGWVLLEHANLCNPAVLDRLNPLLEPGGTMRVSECGLLNGVPRVVTPHRNFRLLLALVPAAGEVSRAMRNRGIELFLLPETVDPTAAAAAVLPSPMNSDAELLLSAAGLPRGASSQAILSAMRACAE